FGPLLPTDPNVVNIVRAVMSLVGIEEKDKFNTELSGGQQQRIALARALLMHCPVLVLDEALSAIDQPMKGHLREALRRICRELNIATLYISHDREDVLQMAEQVLYMSRVVIQKGSCEDVYLGSRTQQAASFFGHKNLFEG